MSTKGQRSWTACPSTLSAAHCSRSSVPRRAGEVHDDSMLTTLRGPRPAPCVLHPFGWRDDGRGKEQDGCQDRLGVVFQDSLLDRGA